MMTGRKIVKALISILVVLFMAPNIAFAIDTTEHDALLAAATAGDAEAQFKLAEIYLRGDRQVRDYSEALSWYEKSARQGNVKSQYQLGKIYQYGTGTAEKDLERSFEWFLKAAEQGHVPSETQVSLMYKLGIGVEKNAELGEKWSMKVLRSKGLIDDSPRATPKSVKRPVVSKKKPRSVSTHGLATKKTAKITMTAEQRKAWRREQARRLVEESNRASAEGEWSDEE